MEYNRNQLFFSGKRVKVCTYVSFSSYILFAIALYLFIATDWLPAALPFICAGTVILVVCLSVTTSESQYKQQVTEIKKEMEAAQAEFFDYVDEDPDHFFKFESYDLTDDFLPLRLGKNNRVYSSTFTVSHLALCEGVLKVFCMRRSLTEPGELEKHSLTMKYEELSGAEIVNDTAERTFFDGKKRQVKRSFILILDKDKNTVAKIESATYDYNMDKFKATLEHNIERATKKDA